MDKLCPLNTPIYTEPPILLNTELENRWPHIEVIIYRSILGVEALSKVFLPT